MSKKKKKRMSPLSIDSQFGMRELIPSTQQAFHKGKFTDNIRHEEKKILTDFKAHATKIIEEEIRNNRKFPTENEVFVFIVQYFLSEKEYGRRDIDNLSKTILDLLNGRYYYDDRQVRTLLVTKKKSEKGCIDRDFAYIAVKILHAKQDIEIIKLSGIDRSVSLFYEMKSKGILS